MIGVFMRFQVYVLVIVMTFVMFLAGCGEVAITGRKQMILVPDNVACSMSFSAYKEFLKKHKISKDFQKTEMLKRVGKKIQIAVVKYCSNNNYSLSGYKWEFNLIEDKAVNAWAMPGGKVVVYTGLLTVAKTDADLAVVLGHEIAHAIAKHGQERMTQGLLAKAGGVAVSAAAGDKVGDDKKKLLLQAYGAGAQYGVMLPFSRLHESEADRMGLIFMAMAGYDPNVAVGFWQNMAKQKGDKKVMEFLSTHPSDKRRIRDIKRCMPEALNYFPDDSDNLEIDSIY